MNICGKNKSVTAYLKKIEKIKTTEDLNIFMDSINLETIPFFQNKCSLYKNRNYYYSLPFIAILSGNDLLLDKLLTLFPKSLDDQLFIQQQKINKKYTANNEDTIIEEVSNWDTIQSVLDEKLMGKLIQKIAFDTDIHDILHKYNLLDNILMKCIENDNTNRNNFTQYIIRKLPEYYFDNKIKTECGKFIFQKELSFHSINKYKHTEESFKEFKKHYQFFTGNKINKIFSDPNIVVLFFTNPEFCYLNEFFKYHKINDKHGRPFDGFNNFDAFTQNTAANIIKNHPSLDLLKKIEPFFNDLNHLIRLEDVHRHYVNIFSDTKESYKDFYLELNKKYSFLLPLEKINTDNLDNLQTVINSYPQKISEKEIEKLILHKLNDEDFLYNKKLFENILKMNNVDQTGILNSIIKILLKLDDSDETTLFINFVENLSSNKVITISLEDLKIESSNNKSSTLLENYLLNKTIEKGSVLKNKIKNRL